MRQFLTIKETMLESAAAYRVSAEQLNPALVSTMVSNVLCSCDLQTCNMLKMSALGVHMAGSQRVCKMPTDAADNDLASCN